MAKKAVIENDQTTTQISKLDEIIGAQFDDLIAMDKVNTSVKDWIDSGVYALNYICSKNLFYAYPCGRVVSIDGLASTGKSLLVVNAAKDPTVKYVAIIETEGGGSTKELLEFAGVNTNKVRMIKANTFENYRINKQNGIVEEIPDDKFPSTKKEDEKYKYFEGATRKMKRFINTIEFNKDLCNEKIMIILDSLGNIQTTREMNGIKDVGYKSQKVGEFFRNFDLSFERTNIMFIFTNKVYTNIMGYKDSYIPTGGVNVDYNPSLALELKVVTETEDVSDSDMVIEKDRRNSALGSSLKVIRVKVKKSRFGTELRRINFIIDFSVGPMKFSGLFELCRDFGLFEKKGVMYTIPGVFDKPFYKKEFLKLMADDEAGNLKKIQTKLEETEQNIIKEKQKLQINDISELSEKEVAEEIIEGSEV